MNKKKIIIIATLAGLLGSAVAVEASSVYQRVSGLLFNDITVKVDDKNTSMKPVFINGQFYLPAKSEANALGFEYQYNERDKRIWIKSRDKGNNGGGQETNYTMLSGIIQGVKKLNDSTYQLDVLAKGQLNWIQLNVDNNTKLLNSNGKTVAVKDLKAGTEIIAEYGPETVATYPIQSRAAKVTVVSDHFIKEDYIQSVKLTQDGWQIAFGEKRDGYTYTSLILNAGKGTNLSDKNGQSVAWESLKAGMKVRAYYGPTITRGVPPISALSYLVVTGEQANVDVLTPAAVKEFQALAWSRISESQEKHLKTKKYDAAVSLIDAANTGVLATTDEAKKILQSTKDNGGKLVTVTYQTDQDELLGPLTAVFTVDSKVFIGFNIRR